MSVFSLVKFLQRVRIARNAVRARRIQSVRLPLSKIPMFCSEKWRYDRAVFSLR